MLQSHLHLVEEPEAEDIERMKITCGKLDQMSIKSLKLLYLYYCRNIPWAESPRPPQMTLKRKNNHFNVIRLSKLIENEILH